MSTTEKRIWGWTASLKEMIKLNVFTEQSHEQSENRTPRFIIQNGHMDYPASAG